ncbi:hypothetical protein DB347_17595 [Opitutaceae bacterium EW11]|nr:hypothetical protein DB347_17595 [Opitutaceae bacterium EW11]
MILERFCGVERYPICRARWNLYYDATRDTMNLCIQMDAGRGTALHDDTAELDAEPWWEIDVVAKQLSRESLVPGTVFNLPNGYEESQGGHITDFYYCEHENTEKNLIRVIESDGQRLRFRVLGDVTDVSIYDGSKPRTMLHADAWFTFDSSLKRSMT